MSSSAASSFAALKAQRDARRNPLLAPPSAGPNDTADPTLDATSPGAAHAAPAAAAPIGFGRPSQPQPQSQPMPMRSAAQPTPLGGADDSRAPRPHAPRNKPEPGAAGSRVRLPDIQDLELRFDAISSERALFYAPLPKNGPSPADFRTSSAASAFSPAGGTPRSLSGSYSYSYSQLLSSSFSAPGGWAAAGISACRPGDVLLRLRPEVAVLSTALLEQRCSACYSSPSPADASNATAGANKLQRCSGCKVLRYCSAACQRRDWPSHRDECKALKAIQQLHTYRSALRQQRRLDQRLADRFAKGQGGSAPFAIGSFQDNDEVMAAATATGEPHDADSDADSDEADADAKRGDTSPVDRLRLPSSMMRALARWIWARSRIGTGGKDKASGDTGDLLELCSHRERYAPEELQQQAQLALHLAQYLTAHARAAATFGPVSRGEANLDEMMQPEAEFSQGDALRALGIESATELLDLVCQFSSNSFTLTDSDLNPLGVCMHASMAMLNHSCAPNAAVVFPFGGAAKSGQQNWSDGEDAKVMQLVALRAIEPGEELLISYVDVADAYEQRRSALKKRYCFECRCELCRKSQARRAPAQPFAPPSHWVDPRTAVGCAHRCGGWIDGALLESSEAHAAKCNKCGSAAGVSASDVAQDREHTRDALTRASRLLERNEAEAAWNQCATVLPMLVERYPPSWQPLFQLLRLSTTCLIEAGSNALSQHHVEGPNESAAMYCFDEAVRMQMLFVAGTQTSNTPIYAKGHPARAIAIATLAKLVLAQLDHVARPPSGSAQPVLPDHVAPNATVCQAAVEGTNARDGQTLSILRDPPSVPDEMRVDLAKQLLVQAVEELDIGFGRSNQGGRTGHEMRTALNGMQQELQLLAQTSAMSVS
ncbi:hypothetical protein PaG_01416 [Moesziomyces aphidis]|uniref:SET domain-containing protein n=1 Tax=Moesziomyces aphidis TaxID=84754 RepID=W3VRJ4_MOEAP|nr:hypothetical protein PaG_01416 [Moesziomyces aphidis]